MTIFLTAAATLAAAYACTRLSAFLRRPRFPHDICPDCRSPRPVGPQRRARTDEQIDRLARRIHARVVREHGDA